MNTEAATTNATVAFFIAFKDPDLRAFATLDLFKADFPEIEPITTVDGLAESDIPLEAITASYNKISAKKVRGFKNRKEGSAALVGVLQDLIASMSAPKPSTEETLTKALKPKKEPRERKPKEAGSSEGRNSPLAGKFWARSGNALKGRRIGGAGVGIKALQYIINNPGCTTEDYLANSGGGRFVDLQYDYDFHNIVMLTGATAEDRAAEIAKLDAVRVGAEQAAADKEAAEKKAKEEKKAKAEAEKADKKAKADKEKAEKKAAAEAKAKEEAAAAEAKSKEEAAAKK